MLHRFLSHYRGKVLQHVFLIGVGLFSLGPVLWLLGIAFRPIEETYVTPMNLLPRTLTLENTEFVFKKLPQLVNLYYNSFIIVGVTVISVVIMSSLAGFAFGRLEFPGRDLIFWVVMASMFMPRSMAIIGLFNILHMFRLLDTLPGLFLPYTAWFLALNTFIMRSAFTSIPKEMEDAARIDGCSLWQLFWKIMMPLARTSTVSVAIFTFVPVWGEYLFAFTFTSTMKAMPISIGVKLLQTGAFSADWTFPVAAMAVLISFIPPLIIYIGLQRWFSKGLMEGALKF